MGTWTPVNARARAVAIYPFNPQSISLEGDQVNGGAGLWQLKLTLGDTLVIKEESDVGWYRGHLAHNSGLVGIFPKSYVSRLSDEKDVLPLVKEITSSLREWNFYLKEKFISNLKDPANQQEKVISDPANLPTIKAVMREVMTFRRNLMSGLLTLEEAKEIQEKATKKMDFLNDRLGLDLNVRNEDGSPITHDSTSAISCYRHHVAAFQKVKNVMKAEPIEISSISFKIMMSVKNFVSVKVTEDVDLLLSIYEVNLDTKTPKPLCENYVVQNWKRNPEDPKDLERRNNLKVLFTDISKNDVTGKRLFLICYVVSESAAKIKGASKSDLSKVKGLKENLFRKPVGVAAVEITDLFTFKQGKSSEPGKEKELSAPFLAGSDNESLETTFKKLISEKKGVVEKDTKSLWVSVDVMMGSLSQSPREIPMHPLSGSSRLAVARKIGLPEIILPSDFRNDLYITIVSGEFSRLDRRLDRNVEVTVEVCDHLGQSITNAISVGEGAPISSSYTSVVYYHEGKPRWNEVIKVVIPVDQFTGSHIRFTFCHKSANASKEKSQPWAMAFLKLVNDHDKTAIKDGAHELLVYKIEKKFDHEASSYLDLPFFKSNQYLLKQKTTGLLTALPKDSFQVQTTLCSTKLTQNDGLLTLLKWRDEPKKLNENLTIFNQKVNGKEFVKFLPDVLDQLFSILTENNNSDELDFKVFKSLISVILLITEDKCYQQFVPVLEVYINTNFSATLAYNKLLDVLNECLSRATLIHNDLNRAMKCLKYIFKFVVQSRARFVQLHNERGEDAFQNQLRQVLESLVNLMSSSNDDLLKGQEQCLKHMVQSISNIMSVFDKRVLSEVLINMIRNLPPNKLEEEKISTLKAIVHSELFQYAECRKVLIYELSIRIRDTLESHLTNVYGEDSSIVTLCTETLGDVLNLLYEMEHSNPGSTLEDVRTLATITLRGVIKCVASRQDGDTNVSSTVSNMICMFDIMSEKHYCQYIDTFRVNSEPCGRSDLIDFVMEVLGMFRDLVQNNVFPVEWASMLQLQNSVLLRALRFLANTIRDFLKDPFEYQVWSNFFQCAVTFITQPSLQLEKFSDSKREKIQAEYGDMRKDMANVVKSNWFSLGQYKIQFVTSGNGMVGPFLEMTLTPEIELRKTTIPIFFDMMQCEFYSPKYKLDDIHSAEMSSAEKKRTENKCSFKEFEKEILIKLDTLIEAGSGDEHYKELFRSIMMQYCSNHRALKETGTAFVELVSKLMESLLEYRTIITEESVENQMSCILNLAEFYHKIKYDQLYIKYIKKLCFLHEQSDNWAEAAFTLLQYSKSLRWSEKPLQTLWEKHKSCRTQRALKEQLYQDAINNFARGKMYEKAIETCKELVEQYEQETFEYDKLERIHTDMAGFYKAIMTEMRPEPEYFRVAFFGRGFPAFLQNKIFVYRGKGFERLPDFQNRILDQFPNAEIMKTLTPPSEEEKEQPVQLLQINKLDPVTNETKFQNKFVHQQILNYYKVNEINTFTYSRPIQKCKDKSNEFATLWIERTTLQTKSSFPGILQWFSLACDEEVNELCPLENAIETMQKANEELRILVLEHKYQSPALNPLSMKLNGIIDAAVMGGTENYEKAFFNDQYLEDYPEHMHLVMELKNLIAEQIPLLEVGIKVHDFKKTSDLEPLHRKLEEKFHEIKDEVEKKYGTRTCDIQVRRDYRKSSMSQAGDTVRRSTAMSADRLNSTLDLRSPFVSQTSSDTKSRMLNVIGISRKKSTSSFKDENRSSWSNNHKSTWSIAENGANDESSENHVGDSSLTSTVVVVHNPVSRKLFTTESRPTSGNFSSPNLTTHHSRSPSISSNRDSIHDFEDTVSTPPPVPPKNRTSDPESLSMSSNDDEKLKDQQPEIRHLIITGGSKKKAPPPPIPKNNSNANPGAPPMPPKKTGVPI